MIRKKNNSLVLRRMAEEVVQQIAAEIFIPEDEQRDLATSLVRQWITYEGKAVLFLGQRQSYHCLGRTPLGKRTVSTEYVPPDWNRVLTEDWKISPDDLPNVFEQLNCGQSAEITNTEGIPLRLSVDPKARTKHVEPLVQQQIPPGYKKDYQKIATRCLERLNLFPDEKEELACSVARQWQQYQGHACLFIDTVTHQFIITEHSDGGSGTGHRRGSFDLNAYLLSLGFPADDVPDIIAQINLAQVIEFKDGRGVPSRLWHDPRAMKFFVEPLAPMPRRSTPPVFCTKCSAVLKVWQPGEQQQTCPLCGHTISLS